MPSPSRAASPSTWLSGVFLLALSTLAILPAPIYALALLAIPVTECGYLLAAAVLFVLLLRRQWMKSRPAGAAAALAAACVLLTPVARAIPVARQLPPALAAGFGRLRREAAIDRAPLDFVALFRGAPSLPVQKTTAVYASRGAGADELAMDMFQAVSPVSTPLPVVIVIHGGSWQSGTREEFPALNEHLAAGGLFVASIDYRLAPQSRFPAALQDVHSAIEYVKMHAEPFGADPARIVLMGRSAGSQLALVAAYAKPDASIKGVIAFYGPSDMRYGYQYPNNPLILDSRATLGAYLGGSPADAPEAYDAASAINYVGPTTPPTLLIHGGRDQLVKDAQSARLDDRLRLAGRAHYFLRLPWATHGCDYNFRGPCGQLTTYAVDYFLRAVLE